MRNLFFSITILSLSIMASCGPTPDDAAKYNNSIVKEQTELSASLDSVVEALNTYDTVLIAQKLKSAAKQIEKSKNKINKLGDFHGDTAFYFQAKRMIATFEDIVKEDFARLHSLYSIPDSLYTEENRLEAKKISKKAFDARQKLSERFLKAQKSFIKNYELKLDSAELLKNDTSATK